MVAAMDLAVAIGTVPGDKKTIATRTGAVVIEKITNVIGTTHS